MTSHIRHITLSWVAKSMMIAGGWLLCGLPSDGLSQQLSTAQQDQCERFLETNGLVGLQLARAERELDRSSGANRQGWLDELSRRYADVLFAPANTRWSDADRARAFRQANNLVLTNPNFRSEDLRLAMLHYQVNLLIGEFLKSPFAAGPLGSIQRTRSVELSLVNLRLRFQRQTDDLERLAVLSPLSSEDRIRLKTAQRSLAHCDYLLGWGYLVTAAQLSANTDNWQPLDADRRQLIRRHWRDAESYFRRYLGVDRYQRLNQLTAQQILIDGPYQHHALLGLAYVFGRINSRAQADWCFSTAEKNAIHSSGRQRWLNWKLIDQLQNRRFDAVLKQVQDSGAQARFYRQPSSINLIVDAVLLPPEKSQAVPKAAPPRSLATPGHSIPDRVGDRTAQYSARDQLFQFAIDQLCYQWRVDELVALIGREDFQAIGRSLDRSLATAYVHLHRFEQHRRPQDLLGAIENLQTLVKRAPQPSGHAADSSLRRTGHAWFIMGQCRQRQDRFVDAETCFFNAAKLLDGPDRSLAARCWWQVILANKQIRRSARADQAKRADTSARIIAAAQRLQVAYPGTKAARRSRFEEVLLACEELPWQDAIDQLEQFPQDHPSYADAKLKANFLLLAALADGQSPLPETRTGEMAAVIAKIQRQIDRLDDSDPAGDYYRRRLQFYRLQTQELTPELFLSNTKQMLQVPRQHPDSLPALVHLGQYIESIPEIELSNRTTLRQRAIVLYQRLIGLLDQDSPNWNPAHLQLARLFLLDEQIDKAERIIQPLHDQPETQQQCLIILAKIAMAKQDFDSAQSRWRSVVTGSTAGSSVWLDANWNYLRCLTETDSRQSARLAHRLLRLYPDLSDQWRDRYESFATTGVSGSQVDSGGSP